MFEFEVEWSGPTAPMVPIHPETVIYQLLDEKNTENIIF